MKGYLWQKDLEQRREGDEGISHVSRSEPHTEGTASTNVLRLESIWHIGETEKKPEQLEQKEGGREK